MQDELAGLAEQDAHRGVADQVDSNVLFRQGEDARVSERAAPRCYQRAGSNADSLACNRATSLSHRASCSLTAPAPWAVRCTARALLTRYVSYLRLSKTCSHSLCLQESPSMPVLLPGLRKTQSLWVERHTLESERAPHWLAQPCRTQPQTTPVQHTDSSCSGHTCARARAGRAARRRRPRRPRPARRAGRAAGRRTWQGALRAAACRKAGVQAHARLRERLWAACSCRREHARPRAGRRCGCGGRGRGRRGHVAGRGRGAPRRARAAQPLRGGARRRA